MNPFEALEFRLSLGSDNHSGVHPKVMQAIIDANRGHAHAYGLDEVCRLAELEFTRVFGPDVMVQYVFTGTAANVLALSTGLKSYNGVITSEVSHLHLDECGAPEKFLGGKLWTLPSIDGRIRPEQSADVLDRMGDQHFSQPKIVSLTLPTELGVTYTLDELHAWRKFTRAKGLLLHLDGARLANAAATMGCSLKELTSGLGVDLVSLGGTKNGLMGAEAVLIFNPDLKADFKYLRKQAMQLSSKTRFLAAQFYAYLKDDLWRDIARHSTKAAADLAEQLKSVPELEVVHPVQSNALFVRLPKSWVKPLRERIFFYIWDHEQNICRWMLGFDWRAADTNTLLSHIHEVKKCFPIK